MNRLLIATTNPAKLAEYRLLLREFALDAVSLRDLGIDEEPEETGATFVENALIKVRFYFARGRIPTIADDGGLEVDALGGEPGVRSHRWLGDGSSDDALAAAVVARMRGVAAPRRSARLCAAVALTWREESGTRERVEEAALEGTIAHSVYREIRPGFPYRAVLYLPARQCYLGALGDEEEARLSQRRVALQRLRDELTTIAAG